MLYEITKDCRIANKDFKKGDVVSLEEVGNYYTSVMKPSDWVKLVKNPKAEKVDEKKTEKADEKKPSKADDEETGENKADNSDDEVETKANGKVETKSDEKAADNKAQSKKK